MIDKKSVVALFFVFATQGLFAGFEEELGAAFGVNANVAVSAAPRRGGDERALELADEAGSFDIVLWQWPETQTLKPVIIARARAARGRGMGIMLGISPTSLSGLRTDLELPAWVAADCGLTTATVSFANLCVRQHFIDDVVDIASTVQPDSFHLATEINTLLLRKIAAPADLEYVHFGTLYQQVYNAIKGVSPGTKVFVSLQYELQKVLQNAPPATPAQNWENILGVFRGTGPVSKLDYVGFTTYPSASGFLSGKYANPMVMPAQYYKEAGLYLRPEERSVISEIGWPTAGSGTETEQRQFVQRLPDLLSYARPAWVAWVLLHDIPSGTLGFTSELTTTGLLDEHGFPKPSWRRMLSGSRRQGVSRRVRSQARGVWEMESGGAAPVDDFPPLPR